ncbi:hypothetical protein [Microbacterium gilvum]|uniref:Holin n=1 Tax=Microbacterium gilvum TaxID=1336204 RepID=A0ABP8ZR88_9MICO
MTEQTSIPDKVQRVLRTVVQVILGAVAVLGIFVAVAPQVLAAIADVLPASWVAWAAGVITSLAAVSAALARVMAIPAVDAWLKRIGLGSAPRSAPTIVVHETKEG